MNAVLENIKNRRSVRTYKDEQLKDCDLNAILEAGAFAPSGHNDQPWHFTVIQNKEFIDNMNVVTKDLMRKSDIGWIAKMGNGGRHIYYNAPTVVIVSGNQNAYSPLTDCSAAIQNMLLAAESLGIGSVWIGLVEFLFQVPEEVAKLHIPEGYKPYYAVSLGYKVDGKKVPVPERKAMEISYIK